MTIPVSISLSIQKYLNKLNYFLLEAGDEFRRIMADYNLLLVAIPEDTRKSEPINQKNKLKTLL